MSNKLLLGLSFLLLLAIALLGCSEAKKLKKAEEVFNRNHLEASAYCAEKFPVNEIVTYLPGTVKRDTLWNKEIVVDTIFPCPASDTVVRYKIQLQTKVQTIVEQKTDTLVKEIENLARVVNMDLQLKEQKDETRKAEDKIKSLEEKRKATKKFILWLLIITIAETLYIFRKPLIKILAI